LGIIQQLGFWVLCAYLLSGILNGWTMRLMGMKGYVSTVALVALPLCWLISGSPFRGLRQSMGWWWAGFLAWVLLATPFSIWRGGSVELLVNYLPRGYVLFFFVAALTVSFRNCRQLMYVNVAAAFMTLLTCVVFGTRAEDGRYQVPGFFENSNELAMLLLMGITQLVYLLSQKSLVGKFLAVGGIALSMPYLLWTGSRGALLGAFAYAVLLLYMSRNRVRALAIMTVLAAIGIASAPSAILHRLTLLTGDEEISSKSDLSAVASRMSRLSLLKRSVSVTFSHPILGVGPGQFPVEVMDEAKAKNEWYQYLGTHNSYTQVSSECGIPAFLCYFAVIVLSIRLNYKVWKRFRNRPKSADITSLAVALLSGAVVYSVTSFFFHMAYTGTLPLLAGQTVALYFAAKQRIGPNEGKFA
jgi:hypothetical protein